MKRRTGSMLARICQTCERKYTCNVKRMEMYWYNVPDDCPQIVGYLRSGAADTAQSAAGPVFPSCTPKFTINMGECNNIQTSHEQLERQLQRDLEKQLLSRCFHFGA